jgi:hypothetical protein
MTNLLLYPEDGDSGTYPPNFMASHLEYWDLNIIFRFWMFSLENPVIQSEVSAGHTIINLFFISLWTSPTPNRLNCYCTVEAMVRSQVQMQIKL